MIDNILELFAALHKVGKFVERSAGRAHQNDVAALGVLGSSADGRGRGNGYGKNKTGFRIKGDLLERSVRRTYVSKFTREKFGSY